MFITGHIDVFVQAAAAVATAITAVLAHYARLHAKEARDKATTVEDAVNHRHSYDGAPPRLYDLALENRRRLTDAEFNDVALFEAVNRIEAAVAHHVEWEEQEKYAELEAKLDSLMRRETD